MQARDEVEGLHNFREFSQLRKCLHQATQTQEKVFYSYSKILCTMHNCDVTTVFTYSLMQKHLLANQSIRSILVILIKNYPKSA